MARREFNKDSPAAKGYETPTFDNLSHRKRKFVLAFSQCHDEEQAALRAGYNEENAAVWGFELGRHPEIVKALEEITARKLASSEFSRAAVINRLKLEASVTMDDLCLEVEYEYAGEMKSKWRPRPIGDVPPHYRGCTSLITVTREGHAQFNNTAQMKARELLAKYMKWDREEAHSAPPIMFDFSGIKG